MDPFCLVVGLPKQCYRMYLPRPGTSKSCFAFCVSHPAFHRIHMDPNTRTVPDSFVRISRIHWTLIRFHEDIYIDIQGCSKFLSYNCHFPDIASLPTSPLGTENDRIESWRENKVSHWATSTVFITQPLLYCCVATGTTTSSIKRN